MKFQAGSNGVKFLRRSGMTDLFTQDDVNKGKIRLSHQQQFDVHDNIDVVVFQVVLDFLTYRPG